MAGCLGPDFIFLEQMPGSAYAQRLGGVQFRKSIKVLCSLVPLLPPASTASAKVGHSVWARWSQPAQVFCLQTE